MRLLAASWLVCLVSLGFEPKGLTPAAPAQPSPAVRQWEKGQQAMMAGDMDGAIVNYQESLRLDPDLARNYLGLAAASLEKGAEKAAAEYMGTYLRRQPEHTAVRVHYGDLLVRLGRPREARQQYERFVADAQSRPALADEHLVHCHSKLMEIAESQEDGYGEHLNRGIGLYLLAKQREAYPDAGGEMSAESMLCKAAGELTLASRDRPDEARPCWYLSAVWTELAQRRPAARWLRAAEEAAPFTYLTPGERTALRLACRQESADARSH
jgi:tetratricopeptide (TPR) repeat protein